MNTPRLLPASRVCALTVCAFALIATGRAQQATVAVTPAQLAKYDKNKNGVLDPDELSAMQADEAKAARNVQAAKGQPEAPSGEKSEVVQLTPFEVNASDDHGYAAQNTLSGTRLNSKLEDIAGSISVVTKQQLQDTAALDINDIFQFEIGTEGTSQFTDPSNDGRANNDAQDNVNGNPTGANRMRGLSSANIAVNGFTSSSSIPIDPYNLEAVEISRGPNSNIAGLSDAGGTVNLITSAANLTRETTGVSFRGDSYGGFRGTMDFNRPLIRNKLAFRFSAAYTEVGYVRKPSVDRTTRQQYALTYRPFPKTTLSATLEAFNEFAQRANSVTPRDTLTNWINRGRPTYDPVTNTSTVNGQPVAGMAPGISGIGSSNARILQYIDNGTINIMERGNVPATPAFGVTAEQFSESSAEAVVGGSLFHAFGSTNKAVYDWTKINTAASNYELQHAQTANVTLEQNVFNTPRNRLNFQGAWRREDQTDYRRMFIGQTDGVPAILEVDTNSRLLDGRPNPYFLHPFIGGLAPQVYKRPLRRDSFRWQGAYQLDLRHEQNLLKWLGLNNVVAYQETSTTVSAPTSTRYHDIVYDNPDFQTALAPTATVTNTTNVTGNAGALFYPLYYVGDKPGEGIKYANTGPVNPDGLYNAAIFNTTTGKWNLNDPVNIKEVYFAIGTQKKKLRTSGVTLQSFLWQDRIVPTLGVREDRVYTEDNRPLTLSGGYYDEANLNNFGINKKYNKGRTRTKGVVFKPFRGWSFLDREAGSSDGIGSYFAEAVRGLSFHYNRSDSFVPADTAYNVFLTQLPNPMGKADEYGVSLNLFNKFNLRLTHQDTIQFHTRSSLGVVATRLMSIDFPGQQTLNFNLYDDATTWQQQLHPEFSVAQAQDAAAKQIGFTTDYIAQASGKTISDANDAESKGWELELQFNPTRYWTLKATGNQQVAIDSNISVYMSQYIALRLPFWTTVKDPLGNLWWTLPNGSQTPQSYFNGNVLSPLTVALGNQGLKKPQTREYTFNIITNYRLAGLGSLAERFAWMKGVSVGGAYRWASQGAIGYYGSAPDPTTGLITTLDRSKPFYDKAVGHLDLNAAYRTRLFNNRIGATFQLNIKDATENGHLQGYAVNPDGRYWAFRIVDPRQFVLTASFDL
ncbi:MAG TPA: TonB-dependent receptor plug domain-containing protein [Opitutaceae bacterium]|nr:TonB-dependent receptor plug domain-containing protein [Opitutaceae bacterium]